MVMKSRWSRFSPRVSRSKEGIMLDLAIRGADVVVSQGTGRWSVGVKEGKIAFVGLEDQAVRVLPTLYAMTGGLLLQYWMGFNFSVAAWIGYIALFGIAVETGVVMVIYLHEALDRHIARGNINHKDIEQATIEGAVQRLRPKLMTVAVVMLSLAPILWESGISSDVMKPIAAPIVGGMITSTIHVLILVPVFFAIMKERALRKGTLTAQTVSVEIDITELAGACRLAR
jgi:Cu(I)/Ag(I) efflux system membrane protein CusA/SilA